MLLRFKGSLKQAATFSQHQICASQRILQLVSTQQRLFAQSDDEKGQSEQPRDYNRYQRPRRGEHNSNYDRSYQEGQGGRPRRGGDRSSSYRRQPQAHQSSASTYGELSLSQAAQLKSRDALIDQAFKQRYGKVRSQLLDSWLEMETSEIASECERMGIKPSSKHIENIQNLFEHIKKVEQEIEAQGLESPGLFGGHDFNRKPADTRHSVNQEKLPQPTQSTAPGGIQYIYQNDTMFKKREHVSSAKQEVQKQAEDGMPNFKKSEQKQFALDQEKARENLNEQLARILSKRKGIAVQPKEDAHTKEGGHAGHRQHGTEAAETLLESQVIQNPFSFSFASMRQSLQERGPLSKESSTQGAAFSSTTKTTDSSLIDRYFDMNSEQLDSQFKVLTAKGKESAGLFSAMDLKSEDFEKLQSITKKKVLINMTTVRQQIPQDPNPMVTEQRMSNLRQMVNFGVENRYFLTDKSKLALSEQFVNLLKATNSSNLKSMVVSNLQFVQDALKLARSTLSKDAVDQLKHRLGRLYTEESDRAYSDASLEQMPEYAKVVKFLSSGGDHLSAASKNKVRDAFYYSLRRILNKRSLKALSFDEHFALLEALPISSSQNDELINLRKDAMASQKSLQYQILNELVSQSPTIKEDWAALSKEQVFTIVQRCMDISKCRDINNKLRGALLYISTQNYSLADFEKLFTLLSTDPANDLPQTVDVKLISNLLLRRNVKTAANLLNTSNTEEIRKHFEFFSNLFKINPATMAFATQELKLLLTRAYQLSAEQHIPLQEMVLFSKTVVGSTFRPSFFFGEMLGRREESFRTDVNKGDLYDFVGEIMFRVRSGEYGFEHLQQSNSRMHRNYKAYTDKTILLLQRIVDDLVVKAEDKIFPEDMRVVSRIFANPEMANYLFKNAAEAESTIAKIADSLQANVATRLGDLVLDKRGEDSGSEFDFPQWRETFDSLRSMAFLLGGSSKLGESAALSKIVNEVMPALFNLLKQEIYKTSSLTSVADKEASKSAESPIEGLLKLNKSIINLVKQVGGVKQSTLYNESQVKELVTAILESHFLNKKPFILSFEKLKKNIKITKLIQSETNTHTIQSNASEIISFLNESGPQMETGKDLARELAKTIKATARSIVGEDLVGLFKMIDRFGITEECKDLIVAVSPNLMTIEAPSIFQWRLNSLDAEDELFTGINERLKKQDQESKLTILKKYLHIFQQSPHLLKKPDASLSPLSYLMAEVLEFYNDEEVLQCLEILGSDKVDNYHEEFIKKIYERYSQPQVIENMMVTNQRFFLKFAKHWPHFLKNNAILNQLITFGKQSSTLAKQQSETLHILTRKNVLHPELLEAHLETFMKMKDRERVMEYLEEYLHSVAFLGYTSISASDIQRITQLFRRLHKSPEQVPSMKQLLDYMMVLALSNTYYKEFDEKSVDFVEKALTLIEKRFTGLETIEVALPNPVTGEEEKKLKLNYYKSIPSDSKIYNKVLLKNTPGGDKDQKFAKVLRKAGRELYMGSSEEALTSEKDIDDEGIEEEVEDSKPLAAEADEPEVAKPKKTGLVEDDVIQDLESTFGLTREDALPAEDGEEPPEEEIQVDGVSYEQKSKMLGAQRIGNKKERKIYERKAGESFYSEELEFHQFRKKKLQDLDKKSKHLLLFSNINQLNFVDVNQSDLAKAWSLLFHFRSKSFDSILYGEFESITMRNTIGKSKGHELFSKFYLKLIEASYDKGFRLHLTTKCEKTGWPIDISMNAGVEDDEQSRFRNRKRLALYFFLQEEVCVNTREQAEEPLGLQKLMLKHLQTISDYKVEYVTENDFYMNKNSIDDYVDYLLQERLLKHAPSAKMGTTFEEEALKERQREEAAERLYM